VRGTEGKREQAESVNCSARFTASVVDNDFSVLVQFQSLTHASLELPYLGPFSLFKAILYAPCRTGVRAVR